MLSLNSIYPSVNGEVCAAGQGSWTVFVRFQGCSVGCWWCDTKYTWSHARGKQFTPDELFTKVSLVASSKGIGNVTITGGEPFEQDNGELLEFVKLLSNVRYYSTIYTSGVFPFGDFYRKAKASSCRISYVVDYKLPSSWREAYQGSEPVQSFAPELNNYTNLGSSDVVKFVVSNFEEDLNQVSLVVRGLRNNGCRARMYVSPADGAVSSGDLVHGVQTWFPQLIELGVGVNLQLHRMIRDEPFNNLWHAQDGP